MTSPPRPPRRRPVFWLKAAVRITVLGLVSWGIWRTFQKARGDFATSDFSLAELHYGWLTLAGVLYLLGMLQCAVFWRTTMVAMGQRPDWLSTVRAYYIGTLGKYVPGKALVVVMRTAMVRGSRVDTTVAAAGVFVETLTMMAVGAAWAAAILALMLRDQGWMVLLAAGLAVAIGVPTVPPVFRRILRFLQVHRASAAIDEALAGLDYRLMGIGWALNSLGWLLLGLSLWATLRATPGAAQHLTQPLVDIPLLTACSSLAVVAGFLSLIPGGLVVREGVITALLVPYYGPVAALASAVLTRVIWLAAELLAAGILYFPGRATEPGPAAEETVGDGR